MDSLDELCKQISDHNSLALSPLLTDPANYKFYESLPYEDICRYVAAEKEALLSALPPGSQFHHVGSTSVEGMCGTLNPDGLVIIPTFPPSREVLKAFLECGFSLSGKPKIPEPYEDIWFIKQIEDGESLTGQFFKIHLCGENDRFAAQILKIGHNLRTDRTAFEEYAAAKREASVHLERSDIFAYKRGRLHGMPIIKDKI